MVSTFKEANPYSIMEQFLSLSLLKNSNSSDTEEIEIDSIFKKKRKCRSNKEVETSTPGKFHVEGPQLWSLPVAPHLE